MILEAEGISLLFLFLQQWKDTIVVATIDVVQRY